jgi:hypothetical protein
MGGTTTTDKQEAVDVVCELRKIEPSTIVKGSEHTLKEAINT